MAYQTTGTITGIDVFQRAITMMDELNDNGEYNYEDTKEYQDRTLSILNILQNELYPYSDTYPKYTEWDKGRRPILLPLANLSTSIDLDDYCAGTALPYGLAAHLLIDENPTSAGYFQQRYDELKMALMRGVGKTSASEDIEDCYGPIGGLYPYNEFSRWA